MELIQASDLVKVARLDKLGGKNTARVLMSILQFDKINQIYARHYYKDSREFVRGVLHDTGIKYKIHPGLVNIPKEGGFIIIANHPYGGIEGLILLDALSEIRPDIKIMANFLFNWIEPIKDKVFAVNPFETHKDAYSSFHGLKKAFHYVCSGHPLVVFPAGEVSFYQDHHKIITDRPWNSSVMRLIENSEVPVIPIYFHGGNSRLFQFMGRVHPLLRTAIIPSELLNKQNTKINIRVGNAITIKEQKEFQDNVKYTRYLRARTYALGDPF
jgi:putative hemolysin